MTEKRWIRKIVKSIIMTGCMLMLSGCHGREGLAAFEIPEQFDESRDYEITFWAKNDTNKTQTAIYEKAIADFETLYPNITVNLRLYTDYGKIYNDVITNIATNTTPNVCITYPDHIATYLTGSNLVVPLERLAADRAYGLGGSKVRFDSPGMDEIIPQFMEECSFGGHSYALPYMRSTEACYVNKTYVEALGYTLPEVLTWDFVWEVSEAALTQDEDGNFRVNGQKVMIPFIYKSTDNMMIQQLWQKDAGYSTEDGEILLFNDTTADLLATIAEHGESGAFSTFKISSYPANFLNAGQCIFAVDSTAGATWMGTDAPLCDISEDKIVEFETEVMMIPQFDTAHPQMISQGPSVCLFNKEDPQEVMAAWLFTQYLLTDEVQTAYAETEGYVPVTAKAQASAAYRDYLARCGEDHERYYDVKIKAARLLLNHVGDTFVTPVFVGSTSLRDAAGQLVENTVKAVRRGQQIDAAYMEQLYSDITALYRLDQIGIRNSRAAAGREELGALPQTSVLLLSCLAAAWICMIGYVLWRVARTKSRRRAVRMLPFVILLCAALSPAQAFAAEEEREAQASVNLTEAEQALVERGEEIVIGCPTDTCPLLYEDEETGEIRGITIDILDMISESTGLRFRYVGLPPGNVTYEELMQLQVDLVASVELNELNKEARGIRMSDPYLQTEKIFVCKKGVILNPEQQMTVAVASGSQTLSRVVQQIYPNFQVDYYDSTEMALAALLSGKADAVLQNQYSLQRILAKPKYENLRVVEAAAIGDFHCLAAVVQIDADGASVADEEEALILSILNKGIAALDQNRVSFSIIKETAENVYQFKMEDFIHRYRYAILLMSISLLLILFLLWQTVTLRRRRKEHMLTEQRAKELAAINEQMREQHVLLEEALVRAEAGNHAKNTFLFNMSHDIRTPMNAIMGFTTIALNNREDEGTVQESLEKIYESACNLMQLMNNVLDMANIESGKITLAEEPCDLTAIIARAQELLQADIDEKRLCVRVDTADMQEQHVYCDALHLNQILYNLLSNAVKFSNEDGAIDVTIRQEETEAYGAAKYHIHVRDHGIGISEEFQAHLFEAFERERTSTISGMQGAGLGLSITKGLVELMGGTIEISSRLQEGTECILSFVFRTQECIQTVQQAEAEQSDEPLTKVDFTGKRLLLVEDNELNAEIAENILQEEGFLVELAENGAVAVEKVQNAPAGYYTMILMDIQMPVMDGYEATKAIRALEQKELASVPIIALTANAFETDKRKAAACGMNAHVSKPIDVEVLIRTLTCVYLHGQA